MPDRRIYEQPAEVQTVQIPSALLPYRQWVCWCYVDRGQGRKPDKRPLNPLSLHNAGVHWPNTWSTFEEACTAYWAQRSDGVAGIGFVLTKDDPFVGVDLDHCIRQGDVREDAQRVVSALDSYTEISPSGAGLRILIACPDFGRNVRRPAIEVYAHSRFLTLTGHHLDGTPDTVSGVGADAIEALFSEREPVASSPLQPANSAQGEFDTPDLWQRIFAHDHFGEQHRRRFSGDTTLDGGDHSLTVIRLLNCLARWTHGDAAQMRALVLMSPLANDKWFSKRGDGDWLDHQIVDAISYTHRGG